MSGKVTKHTLKVSIEGVELPVNIGINWAGIEQQQILFWAGRARIIDFQRVLKTRPPEFVKSLEGRTFSPRKLAGCYSKRGKITTHTLKITIDGIKISITIGFDWSGIEQQNILVWAGRARLTDFQRVLQTKSPEFVNSLEGCTFSPRNWERIPVRNRTKLISLSRLTSLQGWLKKFYSIRKK